MLALPQVHGIFDDDDSLGPILADFEEREGEPEGVHGDGLLPRGGHRSRRPAQVCGDPLRLGQSGAGIG